MVGIDLRSTAHQAGTFDWTAYIRDDIFFSNKLSPFRALHNLLFAYKQDCMYNTISCFIVINTFEIPENLTLIRYAWVNVENGILKFIL